MSDLLAVKDLKVDIRVPGGMVHAVKGADFSIPRGGSLALVGESGSGKSVIAQAIMGILPQAADITGGEIIFHDPEKPGEIVDIAKIPRASAEMRGIRGGRISIIFQDAMSSLSQIHTIGDQIGEALHLHRNVTKKEGLKEVKTMLRLVGFPDPDHAHRMYPFELSGGLRQRAVIAMALICRPALVIADEPTTALDVSIQAQILKLIGDVQKELGMALLIITHDLGVVANIAREVAIIYQGAIMERGGVEDIFRHPGHDYLKGLFRAVPHFDMKEGERLVPLREIPHWSDSPVLKKQPRTEKYDTSKPLLHVANLKKTFTTRKGGFFSASGQSPVRAVNGVSFDVRRGECFGLVGESGCGKTTLGKMIMCAMTPDSGEIIFNDQGKSVDLPALNTHALMPIRQKIQMIFQDPFSSLNPRMTVFDIIREPLIIHNIGNRQSQAEMVKELMRLVGLDPRCLNRYPHCFSGGQCQRIGIARALALKPDLMICDEPVSALDVSIQAQILNLLKDLQTELGLTYLFISHNLAVVDYIATRIAVMCGGRLVEMAPRELLFSNPVHPYTRALINVVPYPDLDRKLDFGKMSLERASDPAGWGEPFFVGDDREAEFIALGGGHIVLAAKGADKKDLVA